MPNKKEDFVHLHTHSDNSTLDGGSKIKDYVEEAKQRGNPAIAFTDHGTMRGYMHQYEECKGTDVKPIYGIEFYVCNNMHRKGLTAEEKNEISEGKKGAEAKKVIKEYEEKHGISKRWHITAWAHNSEGLKNLFRLSSSAYIDGFYYKPRIDLEALCEYKEGISLGTGCLASPVYDSCVLGKKRFAIEFADRLRDEFGSNLWIEVQPHNIPDQLTANKFALELRKRYGKSNRLLATQDAHYVHQSDSEHHEVLLCIGTNNFMSDPNRFKFDGNEFHMRKRKEMKSAFFKYHPFFSVTDVKEALNSTVKLSEMCNVEFKVDYHQALLPDLSVPDKYRGDQTAYLKDLCLEGWAWRNIKSRARKYSAKNGVSYEDAIQTYGNRLKYELGSIVKLKFVPYFLIIRDLYKFARSSGIMCGPGRGSVGGCLVAYLLGITSVDPLEHGLIFERFMNPYRIDLPDIDCDFEDRRRQEIFEYLVSKYGRDKVAQIATVGKLSGKQCLKDVSRVLEVPLSEVNQVTKSIIERSSGDERASQTIADSFKDFDVCRKFDKKYPKVLYHAKSLEGLAKNPGIHAAGVVASPVPLTDLLPLEVRKAESGGDSVVVTATDMYNVAAVGLVKIDVLGLRTLTVIKECLEAIEENTGEKLDLESDDFDLNDPETLQGFTDHLYDGIFQYDTPSADKICMGIKFTDFEDVPAMTALNRPGTARSGLATKYIQRKKNPKLAKKVDFHPKVSEITSDTLGIIVYQEHVIRIFTDIAGFAPGTADSLRKTIAKKIGDETLGKERAKFVEGAAKHAGVDEKTANKIMDAITFFGSYGFNKSHATEYGLIGYWTMWLKIHYPLEFYWALLKNEPERVRIQRLAKAAKKNYGIELKPPHINVSKKHFSMDAADRSIRGSLIDIKGVGAAAADAIMREQPFKDFVDFVSRVDSRKCHKGVVMALSKAGALENMIPSVKWMVENLESIWALVAKKKYADVIAMLEEAKGAEEYSKEDLCLISSEVNPLALGTHPIEAYKDFIEENIKLPIVSMSDEDFFADYGNKACIVAAVIVEVKYNQIGDFHTGDLPSERERKEMFWGARYANVNLEDPGGKQYRTKFDIDVFDEYRAIIDKGIGTPVIACVTPNAKYENLKAHFAVNLESLRSKIQSWEQLNVWELIATGKHPALTYKWKNDKIKEIRTTNYKFHKSKEGGFYTGIVTNVRKKYDKNGNEMAFLGLISADGKLIEIISFASTWRSISKHISIGKMIAVEVEKKSDRRRSTSYFCGTALKIYNYK